MSSKNGAIEKVAVIGSGVMGAAIAAHVAHDPGMLAAVSGSATTFWACADTMAATWAPTASAASRPPRYAPVTLRGFGTILISTLDERELNKKHRPEKLLAGQTRRRSN